ncbi:hypothetical protein HHK36_016701 [Tetracentron sinense]|uniref:Glycosyl transferase family 1 domain-containing protein n=1 Tax=Tetracentron sinense TaxID=13715 RepID=A0A834YXQ2_TETSI|nr:hypothetical protein HHK36_016701 [Tetracentron sinense]
MGRNSSPDVISPVEESGDLGFRVRSLFKRNSHTDNQRNLGEEGDERDRRSDRQWRGRSLHNRGGRKGFQLKGTSLFYGAVFFAVVVFAVASILLQNSMTMIFRPGGERGRSLRDELKFGSSLKFIPARLLDRFTKQHGLDRLRTEARIAIRAPRLAIILGNMKKDPFSLMLFTVMKNLQGLGYVLKFYAIEDGQAHSLWEQIGGQLSILSPERLGHVDWSIFEGVIVDSLEAKEGISSMTYKEVASFCGIRGIELGREDDSDPLSYPSASSAWDLMQEPFCSVPLIWIIQEDILAKRLPVYEEMGWENIVSNWRKDFSRADVVVFPDFSLPVNVPSYNLTLITNTCYWLLSLYEAFLYRFSINILLPCQMLYTVLDTGNFFVIPGSPVDVWAAEIYSKSHSKYQLRKDNGFHNDDLVVLVVGSSFFYNELSWDYAVAMHAIGPLLIKFTRRKEDGASFKFVFLCGNSTEGYNDALQEVASRLGLPHGSIRHYGMNGDVNSVLLMADVVLYGSFQEEQGFPPLLIRSMSFGIPVLAPDLPIIRKYVVDGVHGILFQTNNTDTLMRGFSLLISDMKLSKFAHLVASSGRLLAKNMLALKCIAGYAKLLENVLHFPSDALLPGPISQLQQGVWEWNLFNNEMEQRGSDKDFDQMSSSMRKSSVVYALEEDLASLNNTRSILENETDILMQEYPTQLDWDVLRELETSEDFERREMEELEDRMERTSGSWDEIYRNARKAEKLKLEANERDEGELERIGQLLCIYEIYSGVGASTFLHHGSLYRGLSLVSFLDSEFLDISTRARRSRSDDVDAVGRLPLLNDTYYRDLLCELGGMFSIANRVDTIHKIPWIGFQSWRAAGSKVALSIEAENVLEKMIQSETKGDVIYYWARLDMHSEVTGSNDVPTFWSLCDIFNGGNCRTAFEDAFRRMYALPPHAEALPPMPEDGGHWSTLHSWVMPTPSFLEFVMFSRMFVDSLDSLNNNSSNTCLLGSSEPEKKHCYCRMLELLVNVWAYHSARRMVYMDPLYGSLKEQHPLEQRKGFMWAKYFNFTLLKSMDEDLAEATDDNDYPSQRWLWPLTGEVHWQGIYDREKEERYRQKMEKKRKTREKLLERQKHGYKQNPLG